MNEFWIAEDFPKNETDFDKRFSNEIDCYNYLFRARWPDGFVCNKCGGRHYWLSSRALYICSQCEHQHSVTAGTVMHGTKKPLRYWFKAMWWFTTRQSGINAINLQNLLDLCYETAWIWLQKLRNCTIRRDREQLSGNVEVDEFYIGGRRHGKRGRGAEGKYPVVAAVEKHGRKIGRIRLRVLDNCSSDALIPFIHFNVVKGTQVITDSWTGYSPLNTEGFDHSMIKQSKAEDPANTLPGVHMVASLVKRLMLGTFQGRYEKKYLQKYLDEFVFRFNRRKSKSVGLKFMRIVQQAVETPPITWNQIIEAAGVSHQYAN